jgi:starvation-inducible outer membrane lipoprotein
MYSDPHALQTSALQTSACLVVPAGLKHQDNSMQKQHKHMRASEAKDGSIKHTVQCMCGPG